jgi:hypothetical protein
MVLITNKQSNILQDIDSLHLFAQLVTSICKTLDEREISRNAFDLLSAFDEVIALGYRENLSLAQIRTFLEMESHEERIQEIIARVRTPETSAQMVRQMLTKWCRIRNLRPVRKESARPSNSTCKEKRHKEHREAWAEGWVEWVVEPRVLQVSRHMLLLQHQGLLHRWVATTRMRLKRRRLCTYISYYCC